jgi:hypothetical protein
MDYTPVSRSKAEKKSDTAEERKKHTAVVSASTVKKKSELSKIVSGFVAEEAANIKSKTVNDIIIPTIRDTIWSVITNGLEMLLYGGTSHLSRDSRHSGPYAAPYINYSTKKNRDRDRVVEPPSRSRLDLDDIVFRTSDDAYNVLDCLKDDIHEYGLARVSDLYDLSNRANEAPYTAARYGWTSLERAEVLRLRGGGGYIIKFPRPIAIER